MTISSSFLDKLNPDDIEFINFPVYYPEDEYQRSMEKITDYLAKFDEVCSIYQIGEINEPGISDIDLIVVFDDKIKSFSRSYRKILTNKDSYLLMHSIFGMPVSIFKKSEYLVPISSLRKLKGSDIPRDRNLTSEEKNKLAEIYVLEFFVENLFNLASQLIVRELKVRNILCSLNALACDLNVLNSQKLSEKSLSFSRKIRFMREFWWERKFDEKQELLNICIEAVNIILANLSVFFHNCEYCLIPNENTSFIPVGVNGYVEYSQNCLPSLELKTKNNMVINFLNKFSFLNTKLKKQIIDIKKAHSAIILNLPYPLFSNLISIVEGSYSSLTAERKNILDQYSRFMRRINSEFAILDILRTYPQRNRKWRTLRRVNEHLFAPNHKKITYS